MKIIIIFLLCLLPVTAAMKHELKARPDLVALSEQIALSQVGTTEATNRNDGPVEKYTSLLRLPKGSAYCAAGQYWCWNKACSILNISCKYIPFPATGKANKIFDHAAKTGKAVPFSPKRHDFIVWRFAGTQNGHIERITAVHKAGWVTTVAFNTKCGDKEGVFLKKRNVFYPLSRMYVRGLIGFSGKEKQC